MKYLLQTYIIICLPVGFAQGQSGVSTYHVPQGLVKGAAFIDRFLPVPLRGELRFDVWGAEPVIPRDVNNGIEDVEYSYWGGNIITGADGKEHLFVCRWPESNVRGRKEGHHTWWSSAVVHAVGDSPLGPFRVVDEIGPGHNPEIYRRNDGSYVIGVMGEKAYTAQTLDGPWSQIKASFDWLDDSRPLNKTNRTYVPREDGSILMMNKSGHIFISEQANEHFTQVTERSVYPPVQGARFEDPVIWKDEVQYNAVFNDWLGRAAFYLRSPDGIHWKWAPGKAYDPSVMNHEGGTSERWYKFERPKVRQDKHGRATHMNFAVIDVPKDEDKANDNHSSKNVVVPLVVPRRLLILNRESITSETKEIRVKILAEHGFDPQKDINLQSLIFGAPEQVNFGKGCAPTAYRASGADLIVTFAGRGHGITAANFAAKLIGRTKEGGLLFGYARLPGRSSSNSLSDDATAAVPYLEALDGAAVAQSSIDNIHKKALVVGNGDINALVYSVGDEVVLNVTKNDVWDCRMDTSKDADLLAVNVKEYTWTDSWGAQSSWDDHPYPIQVPACSLRIADCRDIRRARLDLRRAKAEVQTESGVIRLRALWQNNVFLIESDGAVALEGYQLKQLPQAQPGSTDGIEWIRQELPGDGDYQGMTLLAALGVNGRRKAVALVSSHDSKTPLHDAVTLVKQTLSQEYESVVRTHEAQWEQFWSTSGVSLANRDFQNWWYRQLYYFRCFSKPDVTAIGLQAGYNRPAGWHGSYKINYNSWQTFWTPFAYNHPELVEPWVEHLFTYLPRARWFARNAYSCEGAAFHADTWPHEVDPARCKSKNRNQIVYIPWGYTMGMSGMAIQNLWNYYLYRPDRAYLKARIYPVIKEVATFYASFIEQCRLDDEGKAIIGPSYNPEHGPFGTDDNPYDLTYVRYTLEAAIAAAEILDVDQTPVKRFKRALVLIPAYHTTPDPKQDDHLVIADWRGAAHNAIGKAYNITVPVVPLFPGDQFSWFSSEEDKALLERTIHHVENNYNRNNSVVMLNAARARLSMTDDAIEDTLQWFKKKEQPNGLFEWQGHGYYMSEQAAVGALINEFLLQSVDGIIRVFPAWPEDQDASFAGLRAQGGFLVSATQVNGRISCLEITSTVGGKLRLVSPWPVIEVKTQSGSRNLKTDASGVCLLDMKRDERLTFSGS